MKFKSLIPTPKCSVQWKVTQCLVCKGVSLKFTCEIYITCTLRVSVDCEISCFKESAFPISNFYFDICSRNTFVVKLKIVFPALTLWKQYRSEHLGSLNIDRDELSIVVDFIKILTFLAKDWCPLKRNINPKRFGLCPLQIK